MTINPALLVTVLGGGGAAAWTPADFETDLEWWVKYPDGLYQDSAKTTPATVATDPVGNWEDKSGNGRDVKQATSTKRDVIEADSSIGFDGTADILVTDDLGTALTTPCTLVAVLKHKTGSTASNTHIIGGHIEGSAATASFTLYAQDTTPDKFSAYNEFTVEGEALDTDYHVFLCEFNGASSKIRVDGVENSGNAGARNLIKLGVGGNARDALYTACQVKEAFLISKSLSAPEITQVEDYMQAEHGISF